MEGKQAITSLQVVFVHILFDITNGRQTGNQKLATCHCSYFICHHRWKANRQSSVSDLRWFTFHFTSEIEGKQAIRSYRLVIVHISFVIRDRRQSGDSLLWLFTFHLTSEMEGKYALTSQQLVIVHISFDIRDGSQTGNHKSSSCVFHISFNITNGRQTGN
jgi:5-carboxymethyl-2-hydroxymuconate isomerase